MARPKVQLKRAPTGASEVARRPGREGHEGSTSAESDLQLDLFSFVPFRLNRLAAEVSAALAEEYRERYGLDIPGWRILATLGFRGDACTAQFIAQCTRTHKSTISRAVTALLERELIERVENAEDRREFRLRLTTAGRKLYEELVPRLKRKEQEILSCLSEPQLEAFTAALGTIERRLDLIQSSHAETGADDAAASSAQRAV